MQNETCKKVPKKENLDINRNLCVEGKNGILLEYIILVEQS